MKTDAMIIVCFISVLTVTRAMKNGLNSKFNKLWWIYPIVYFITLILSACSRNNYFHNEIPFGAIRPQMEVKVICIIFLLWGLYRFTNGWRIKNSGSNRVSDYGDITIKEKGKRDIIVGLLYFIIVIPYYIFETFLIPMIWELT